MERQENIKFHGSLTAELAGSWKSVFIVILFHLVGVVGLSIPSWRPIFLDLVPFHLLLMLIVIAGNHNRLDDRFSLFMVLIFLLGFSAEWAGAGKHWIFGDYAYGKTLGFQLLGVPLIIGINWFLLTYATGVLMQRSRLKSMFFRILTGSLLLVMLDLLIEPLAMRLDYWQWSGNKVPPYNYLSWFASGALMLTIYELFRFKKQNIVAPVFLLAQFIFFGILYLVQVIFLP